MLILSLSLFLSLSLSLFLFLSLFLPLFLSFFLPKYLVFERRYLLCNNGPSSRLKLITNLSSKR